MEKRLKSNRLFEKKGLSSIVATVLLILFTVLAIVIIAGFIVPFIQKNIDDGTECVDYRSYFEFDDSFDFNCYRTDSSSGSDIYKHAFSIRASSLKSESAEKVNGLKVYFLKEGSSDSVEIISGDSSGSEFPFVRMISPDSLFEVPSGGEIRTYVYETNEVYDSISVAPILDNGRVCDVSDEARIEGRVCNVEI